MGPAHPFPTTVKSFALAVLVFFLALPGAWAHNPDTSYTRIRIEPGEMQSKFTLDVLTLLKIADLDSNHDHRVTRAEIREKAAAIFQFLRQNVRVTIDKKPADFGDADGFEISDHLESIEEKDYHQTLVHFTFRREMAEFPEEIALVFDIFPALGDRHTNLAYVEEAGSHTEEIIFSKFEPDYTYYTNTRVPLWKQLRQFLILGVRHIFLGYDHILFLLALIVVSRFWDLVKIVTAFTVAHTITLMLAAFEIVRLPPQLIETSIAFTIVYVAAENLWIRKTSHRWMLTFAFGLIHGFGFANVLHDMGLPRQGLVQSLVCFNLGVELGQVTIVLLLLPLSLWLGRQTWAARGRAGVSILIGLMGLAWFIDRAFDLRFMPF